MEVVLGEGGAASGEVLSVLLVEDELSGGALELDEGGCYKWHIDVRGLGAAGGRVWWARVWFLSASYSGGVPQGISLAGRAVEQPLTQGKDNVF